jgi:hypothetical protein
MTDTPPAPAPVEPDRPNRGALRYVEEALRGLQFGSVTIIVQDGVVVQVERTERRRFQRSRPQGQSPVAPRR